MIKTNDEYVIEESNASQCDKIIAYLKEGHTLTALEALRRFGCFRLTSRICDLKKRGYNISSKRIKTESGKYVSEYKLESDEVQNP